MVAVVVWSERDAFPRWDDCTESAYLMALLYGGFDRFPLGAYTIAEREALDAAAGPDPAAGGSTFDIVERGALARYGVKLRRIADGSAAGLRARLGQPGRALTLAGSLGRLADGHRLRRWQPAYEGGHALCVVPLGGGRVLWLDPLAPNRHAGDAASVDEAMTFAWTPSNAREALAGEFVMEDDAMLDPRLHRPPLVVDAAPGGTLYNDPDRRSVAVQTWGGQKALGCYATAVDPAARPAVLLPIVVNMAGAGQPRDPQVKWYGSDLVTVQPAVDPAAALRAQLRPPLEAAEAQIRAARGIAG